MYKEKEEVIKGVNYEREENYGAAEEKVNRYRKVDYAIAISMLDAGAPKEETKQLMNDYEEGKITYDELLKKVKDKYNRNK